jgi:hypothetical protein
VRVCVCVCVHACMRACVCVCGVEGMKERAVGGFPVRRCTASDAPRQRLALLHGVCVCVCVCVCERGACVCGSMRDDSKWAEADARAARPRQPRSRTHPHARRHTHTRAGKTRTQAGVPVTVSLTQHMTSGARASRQTCACASVMRAPRHVRAACLAHSRQCEATCRASRCRTPHSLLHAHLTHCYMRRMAPAGARARHAAACAWPGRARQYKQPGRARQYEQPRPRHAPAGLHLAGWQFV